MNAVFANRKLKNKKNDKSINVYNAELLSAENVLLKNSRNNPLLDVVSLNPCLFVELFKTSQ